MRDWKSAPSLATIGLLVVSLAAPLSAQREFPSGDAGNSFAIRNVRVFDGRASRGGQTVLIRDGRIAEVGDRLVFPDETPVVDGAGHTLFPGMIDAHTHTFDPQALVAALSYGVTTVLDQFTSTQFGLPIPTISGPSDVPGFVSDRRAEGSDWLKIIWEDGSNYDMELGFLSRESVNALIRAAADNELRSVVHVSTVDHAIGAAEMGATGLVHSPHDRMPRPGDGAAVAGSGIFMAPTLTITRSIATGKEGEIQLADERLSAGVSFSLRTSLESALPLREKTMRPYDYAKEFTRQMHEAGGRILAGTDAPNPGTAHGVSKHRELELLVNGSEPRTGLGVRHASSFGRLGRYRDPVYRVSRRRPDRTHGHLHRTGGNGRGVQDADRRRRDLLIA